MSSDSCPGVWRKEVLAQSPLVFELVGLLEIREELLTKNSFIRHHRLENVLGVWSATRKFGIGWRSSIEAKSPSHSPRFCGTRRSGRITARDRDRLRQQMLENPGWTFHRIWSTDWLFRRGEEIERAWMAYQAAMTKPIETRDIYQLPTIEPTGQVTFDDEAIKQSVRYVSQPPIPKRNNIAEYSHLELRKLYEWVMSDGVLRTHDEIADEMFKALPFSRRGARIDATTDHRQLREDSVRQWPQRSRKEELLPASTLGCATNLIFTRVTY